MIHAHRGDVSGLVGAIYDCAHDCGRWPDALRQICKAPIAVAEQSYGPSKSGHSPQDVDRPERVESQYLQGAAEPRQDCVRPFARNCLRDLRSRTTVEREVGPCATTW
jgi:hypothetical protein